MLSKTIILVDRHAVPDTLVVSNRLFPRSQISNALRGLDLPLCQNLQLSDPYVMRNYEDDYPFKTRPEGNGRVHYLARHPPRAPDKVPEFQELQTCLVRPICDSDNRRDSIFRIDIEEWQASPDQEVISLFITIMRDLGSLGIDVPPLWRNHLITLEDLTQCARSFTMWEAKVNKIGAKWLLPHLDTVKTVPSVLGRWSAGANSRLKYQGSVTLFQQPSSSIGHAQHQSMRPRDNLQESSMPSPMPAPNKATFHDGQKKPNGCVASGDARFGRCESSESERERHIPLPTRLRH
jgi:hypothetical protein